MIRGANRFFIVLNYDDGIAEVAQPPERRQQTCIVALMQADARLIQNIKNPRKTGADLRRQPDSLCFATGECAALAIKREITESNFD